MRFLLRHFLARAKPPEGGIHQLWEWIEDHGIIVFPAVVLGLILLIAGTILLGLRSNELSAEQRAELKSRVMGIMRRNPSGVTTDVVAMQLDVEFTVAERTLNEMVEEGLIVKKAEQDVTRYKIRSVT